MIGLLARKKGMTQVFLETGRKVPVTVLEVGPCAVTQIRTKEKNGYEAILFGMESRKEKHLSKAEIGFFKKSGVEPQRLLKEIRTEIPQDAKVGMFAKVDNFEVGDFVDVIGISKGRGFAGVLKRHHFTGGPGAHGHKMGREPGSTGASQWPKRVIKGKKLPGHLGAARSTMQNLEVIRVDVENNLIALKGAVPGAPDGVVVIRESLKLGKKKAWKLHGEKGAAQEKPAVETVAEQPEEKKE